MIDPPFPTLIAPIVFGVMASVATLLGGVLSLRLANRIGLILGLTAGVVIGVALFDLLPEAATLIDGGLAGRVVPVAVAAGFAGYMLVRRAGDAFGKTTLHVHLAPTMLTLHSLMDGIGIGFGFQISPTVGGLVGAAVLTHDLADGVNIVSLCLATGRPGTAKMWLAANGAAPLIGVLVGLLFHIPHRLMAPLMAAFAGAFLFIGACELIPRSQQLDPRLRIALASVAGIALMFAVTAVAR